MLTYNESSYTVVADEILLPRKLGFLPMHRAGRKEKREGDSEH